MWDSGLDIKLRTKSDKTVIAAWNMNTSLCILFFIVCVLGQMNCLDYGNVCFVASMTLEIYIIQATLYYTYFYAFNQIWWGDHLGIFGRDYNLLWVSMDWILQMLYSHIPHIFIHAQKSDFVFGPFGGYIATVGFRNVSLCVFPLPFTASFPSFSVNHSYTPLSLININSWFTLPNCIHM